MKIVIELGDKYNGNEDVIQRLLKTILMENYIRCSPYIFDSQSLTTEQKIASVNLMQDLATNVKVE